MTFFSHPELVSGSNYQITNNSKPMIRKFILRFPIFFVMFFLLASVTAGATCAQTFKFELVNPETPINAGTDFQVKILINTAGIDTISGDALVVFDESKVSVNSAVTGDFFTYFSSNPLGGHSDKYLVSSWEESVAHAKSSSSDTLFATMTLSPKASGTTSLSFECATANEADTNINQASDSGDIVKCPLDPLSITIGAGSTTPVPTSAVTPTSVPTLIPTPTVVQPTKVPIPATVVPTSIQQRYGDTTPGTTEVTIAALGLGTLLTFIGVLFIL